MSNDEYRSCFGYFHWHPDFTPPTNYMDPMWKYFDRYGDPDDYYGYIATGKTFNNIANVSGGHAAIVVGPTGLCINLTYHLKYNLAGKWIHNFTRYDQNETIDIAGKYKRIKKSSLE